MAYGKSFIDQCRFALMSKATHMFAKVPGQLGRRDFTNIVYDDRPTEQAPLNSIRHLRQQIVWASKDIDHPSHRDLRIVDMDSGIHVYFDDDRARSYTLGMILSLGPHVTGRDTIEHHFNCYPDRDDRFFINFEQAPKRTEQWTDLKQSTGLYGKNRFYFAERPEAIALLRLFAPYPVRMVYDFHNHVEV